MVLVVVEYGDAEYFISMIENSHYVANMHASKQLYGKYVCTLI